MKELSIPDWTLNTQGQQQLKLHFIPLYWKDNQDLELKQVHKDLFYQKRKTNIQEKRGSHSAQLVTHRSNYHPF